MSDIDKILDAILNGGDLESLLPEDPQAAARRARRRQERLDAAERRRRDEANERRRRRLIAGPFDASQLENEMWRAIEIHTYVTLPTCRQCKADIYALESRYPMLHLQHKRDHTTFRTTGIGENPTPAVLNLPRKTILSRPPIAACPECSMANPGGFAVQTLDDLLADEDQT